MADTASHRLRTKEVEYLLTALRAVESNDELFDFLLDVCTPREMIEMAQRLEVARLLTGGAAYTAIEAATGASATTIARVSKCLQFGNTGYEGVLLKLREMEETEGRSARPASSKD